MRERNAHGGDGQEKQEVVPHDLIERLRVLQNEIAEEEEREEEREEPQ